MKTKQGIAAAAGFALIAMFSTPGGAAERPGQVMADVTARLTVASSHAAVLQEALDRRAPMPSAPVGETATEAPREHDIGPGPDGGGFPAEGTIARPSRKMPPLTAGMTSALDGLEAAMKEARALAGGNDYLEPGIEHVLANARLIRANGGPSTDANALSNEIAIELVALTNNARVLEAEADLKAASAAWGKDNANAFRGHLEAALQVLGEAQEKGAYHLEDDIAALQVVHARVKQGAPLKEAVTADGMDELIGDVHEHLADLRGD
jgi:hypothetical protein